MRTQAKTVRKVFKTKNDEILIVKATTEGCAGRKYVSVTADVIAPILRSEAVDRVREGLEDGELWRMAVQAEQTELGLSEWVEQILSNDELDGFDNSLYTNQLSIDGEDYIFDSVGCGCWHEGIKELTKQFNKLISLHLKDSDEAIEEAESIIASIKPHDVDHEVERFTRQIIGIEA